MVNDAQVDAFLRQLAKLNAPDLRALLTEVFGFQSYKGQRTIRYFNQSGHGLSLTYLANRSDRNPFGVVKELVRGPDLTESDVTRLLELYDILNGQEVPQLDSLFYFSNRRVTGWWRYRDQFQILPPPAGAPLPTTLLGDWPFIVQARFGAPNQSGLTMRRRMQTRSNLSLLLPVLLIGPTYQPHTYRALKHWVIPPSNRTLPPRSLTDRLLTALRLRQRPLEAPFHIGQSMYAQEYYHVEGWAPPVGPELSAVDGMDAALVVDDHEAYYRPTGISGEEVVQVPSVLPQLLDNYLNLNEDVARQYRRACYWFNLARFFWDYSASTSFIAYVVAVESLLPEEAPHTCPTCDAPHHPSITRALREFINAYVPDPPDRNQFYRVRSDITHGSTLLQFDLWEEFNGFFPSEIDQRNEIESLNYVCRIALVNWLMAQAA